ncbi:MAG TPA: CoA pyrophosphatase [Propionibacteriaceae bacterium]|nr:CoA pyrophosphatase [Propionibacteriaceae bacterium]
MTAQSGQGSRVPEPLRALAAGLGHDRILSEAFRTRRFGPEEIGTSREAAVLVLLTPQDDPDVVLIERAAGMRKHAGQIAFPGGALEAGESAEDAALREAWEEVRLDRASVSVLGRLPAARIPVSQFHVHAVVAYWPGSGDLAPQPGEVAQVLRVPVSSLVAPENRSSWRHSSGRTGPGFEVPDPSLDGESLYVWGFSAYVLDAVLEAGGWSRPWDRQRYVTIPARFLPDVRP